MWADAVLEGGGVRGMAFVGAISVAEEKGYRWNRVAGVSAGALVASLMAAGYTAAQMRRLVEELDFSRLIQKRGLLRWPWVGAPLKLWSSRGLYATSELEMWIRGKLQAKGIDTFGDLDPEQLQVVTVDITMGRVLVLPRDLEDMGMSVNDFPVAKAVAMSCTLPYFFEPAYLYDCRGKRRVKHTILDGGLLSRFPVWLFDVKERPRWPTFGFRLLSDEWGQPQPTDSLTDFSIALIKTLLGGMDNINLPEEDLMRSVFIHTGDVKATDFDLSGEQKLALYNAGEMAARDFFSHWDFNTYCQKCRNRWRINQLMKF